ncbi:MAG: hypothetical protein ABIT05_00540 [Chitinophagaceae bacterium]
MKKLLILFSLACFAFSCNDKSKDGDKKDSTDTAGVVNPVAAALPDNAFYCLKATEAQVDEWLALDGGANKYKRIVFNYYWANRNLNPFTLIGFKAKKADRKFDPTPYELTTLTTCAVMGIGTEIILSDQQITIDEIRRLWSFRTGPGPHYLKFTPMVNFGKDHEGNPCNCPRYLVYKVDLVTTGGIPGSDYEAGATNPSPPKPPAE